MNRKDLDALNELYLSVYSGEQLNEGPYSADNVQRAQQAQQGRDNLASMGGYAGLSRAAAASGDSAGAKKYMQKSQQIGDKRKAEASTSSAQRELQKTQNRADDVAAYRKAFGTQTPPGQNPPKTMGPEIPKRISQAPTPKVLPPASTSSAAPRSTTRPAASTSSGTPKVAPTRPATPAGPAKPAIGTTPGGTKFERRTPTSSELRAAQAARAAGKGEEGAVKAGVEQGKADNIVKSGAVAALKPAAPTPSPAPARNGFGASTAPMAAKSSVSSATAPANTINNKKPTTQMSSYEWPSAKTIRDIAGAYSSIYEAKKKVDQDQDGDNDFADVRVARMIASGVPKAKAIAMVKDKSYNEEVELWVNELLEEGYDLSEYTWEDMFEIYEATAMAKRGYDETEIRNKIAKSTGGGKFADKATELENRPTFGNKSKQASREKLARTQRGDFRRTTSSDYGLRLGAHKSNDPAVKAKQAARGKQRSALTPKEKKMLNREAYEAYEFVASYLLENNFASTVDDANVIINNMSEGWFESIMEEKKPLPVAKMKRRETELLGSDEEHLAALKTPMGSPERKKAMKNLEKFDNINTARTSISKRGGKEPHAMPEVGRYKPKDED